MNRLAIEVIDAERIRNIVRYEIPEPIYSCLIDDNGVARLFSPNDGFHSYSPAYFEKLLTMKFFDTRNINGKPAWIFTKEWRE